MRSSIKIHYIIILLLLSAQIGVTQPYEGPDTLWTRVNALSGLEFYTSASVVSLSDGGVMISGEYVTVGETDAGPCMARLDSSGNLLWLRSCNDSIPLHSYPTYMCQIGADLFALASTAVGDRDDPCVTLCNGDGVVLGQRAFSIPYWQLVQGVCPSGDDGVTIIYDTQGPQTGSRIMCAMKVNIQGDCIWNYSYPIAGGSVLVNAIAPTSDGGYVLVGSSVRWTETHPILIVKLDTDGYVEFTRSYNFYDESYATDIAVLANGDYIVSGSTILWSTMHSYAIVSRLDSSGELLWTWFGDPSQGDSYAGGIIVMPDNGYTVGTNSLVRFDTNDRLIWRHAYSLPSPYQYVGWHEILDAQGRFVLIGSCYSSAAPNDQFLGILKTYPDPALAAIQPLTPLPSGISLQVYPNPFNSTTQIQFTLPITQRVSLRLYDVLGREVAVLLNEMKTAGEHRLSFNGGGFSSGVYFCRLEAGKEMRTRKIVLMR